MNLPDIRAEKARETRPTGGSTSRCSPSKEDLASQSSAQGHSSDGRVLVDGESTRLLAIERVGANGVPWAPRGVVNTTNQLSQKPNPAKQTKFF